MLSLPVLYNRSSLRFMSQSLIISRVLHTSLVDFTLCGLLNLTSFIISNTGCLATFYIYIARVFSTCSDIKSQSMAFTWIIEDSWIDEIIALFKWTILLIKFHSTFASLFERVIILKSRDVSKGNQDIFVREL